MADVITKYVCPICEETHDTYGGAEDCCNPEIEEIYLCSICSQEHSDIDEALACCPDEDGEENNCRILIPVGRHRNTADYVAQFDRINHLVSAAGSGDEIRRDCSDCGPLFD